MNVILRAKIDLYIIIPVISMAIGYLDRRRSLYVSYENCTKFSTLFFLWYLFIISSTTSHHLCTINYTNLLNRLTNICKTYIAYVSTLNGNRQAFIKNELNKLTLYSFSYATYVCYFILQSKILFITFQCIRIKLLDYYS